VRIADVTIGVSTTLKSRKSEVGSRKSEVGSGERQERRGKQGGQGDKQEHLLLNY
jgi:hypothetical protein